MNWFRGFGAVYRARQTTINREVAVKAIRPQLASTSNFFRRFETEAELVAQLTTPVNYTVDGWGAVNSAATMSDLQRVIFIPAN